MSVVIETTLGDITVDLFLNHRPRACLNFLKLCKIKYYNYNLFHTISRGFIAQTGDPTGSREGGESIFGVIEGPSKRYFEAENEPRIKHTHPGLISFVGGEDKMIGSQFFVTLGNDLTYLDDKHCVFGKVVEGIDILEAINEVICDTDDRPYQDVRITHTVVLDDPYPDPKRIEIPSRSPSPSTERLAGGRIAPDEEIDETAGKSAREIAERQAEREAKARATILEMIGDIPDADVAPPENVLFVCKLNPVTTDDDLEIIFSRFGKINSCEVIRDRKSGESLQYAFIEFDEQKSCEDAYFKMDNVLIDDRRIHVDFSQSVSKVKWLGKGRGVTYYDDKGKKSKNDGRNDVGKGNYKIRNSNNQHKENNLRDTNRSLKKERRQSRSPPPRSREHLSKRRSRSPKRRSRSPKRRSRSPKRKSRSPKRRSKSPKRRPRSPKRRSRSPKNYQGYEDLYRKHRGQISNMNGRHNRNDKSEDSKYRHKISDRHSSRSDKRRNDYDSEDNHRDYKRNYDNSRRYEENKSTKKSNKIEKRYRSSSGSMSDDLKKSQRRDRNNMNNDRNSSKRQKNNTNLDSDMEEHIEKKQKRRTQGSSSDSDDSSSEDNRKKNCKKSHKKAKKTQKKKHQSSESSSSSDSEDYKKKKHKQKKEKYADSD